ncbi:MAG: hypothetical protein B9S32_15955 [Verrucomicrobia bacterium Tous-C9LFEB]|nr:MAG: hypothetical protein B9S32_15955 [Verrucomicrobia bacterium Tous-C9LFEB]
MKFFLGLVLIPLVVAQGFALVDVMSAWLPSAPWRAPWFWATVGGATLWLAVFFALPRPVWLYVLGHEMTHALAVWLAGGKVYSMHVANEGGHVSTDKVNWWISLSPYFVPLYTFVWLGLWISVDFYYPLKGWQPLLFFGIGLTYAFHVTFTITMLHPDQTDLSGEGYLFSGVVIAGLNLLVIFLMLLVVADHVTWQFALLAVLERIVYCYTVVWEAVVKLVAIARGLAR